MLAIGNNELGEKLGDTIICPKCGEEHPIEFGKKQLLDDTWIETKILSFYFCGGKPYLAGIDGQRVRL